MISLLFENYFFQLRSLKLGNYLDTNPLLDMQARSLEPMWLTLLELNFTSQWDEQDDLEPSEVC